MHVPLIPYPLTLEALLWELTQEMVSGSPAECLELGKDNKYTGINIMINPYNPQVNELTVHKN